MADDSKEIKRREHLKIRKTVNVQYKFIEVREERRLKLLGQLKTARTNTIPKMLLEWNTEGRRRDRKPREKLIDVVRKIAISKVITEEDAGDKDLLRTKFSLGRRIPTVL